MGPSFLLSTRCLRPLSFTAGTLRGAQPQRLRTLRNLPTFRPLSTSPCLRIKEDEDKHHPEAAQAKEDKKQDHLKKQDEGKGEWERELSSSGEEAVKADRQDMDHSDKDIENLQHQTAKGAEKEKGER